MHTTIGGSTWRSLYCIPPQNKRCHPFAVSPRNWWLWRYCHLCLVLGILVVGHWVVFSYFMWQSVKHGRVSRHELPILTKRLHLGALSAGDDHRPGVKRCRQRDIVNLALAFISTQAFKFCGHCTISGNIVRQTLACVVWRMSLRVAYCDRIAAFVTSQCAMLARWC